MNEKVVVIMLNYNQNDYTLKCVDSVLESEYENFEILLIDNGSSKENFIDLKEKLPIHNKLILKRLEENAFKTSRNLFDARFITTSYETLYQEI